MVTIDLKTAENVTTYFGQDSTDLVNVSSSLALGDFNDDGETDALIGAPQADGPDNKREDAGEAYVIFGPLNETRRLGAGSADVTILGANAGDGLGFTTLAGDLNDDGVDDVMVGAPGVTAGFDPRSDQGRVYVFFGSDDFRGDPERDLSDDIFDLAVTGAEGFSRLGHSMGLGDVNGDGVTDLVVGAPFAGRKPGTPPGGERTALGEVYVIYGGEDPAGERNIARDEADIRLSGAFAFGQFGASLDVGDVNDDGTDDIVVGAYRASADATGSTSGAAYVFFGGSDLESTLSVQSGAQDTSIIGPASSNFGFPLTVADLNGDRIDDMAFGAQLQTGGLLNLAGAIHVILGSADLGTEIDAAEADAVIIGGSLAGGLFPTALAASDIDDDGSADLIAGAALSGDDLPGSGTVYVFTRLASASGLLDLSEKSASITVLGAAADDRLGGSVSAGALAGNSHVLLLLAAQAEGGNYDGDAGVVYVVPVSE